MSEKEKFPLITSGDFLLQTIFLVYSKFKKFNFLQFPKVQIRLVLYIIWLLISISTSNCVTNLGECWEHGNPIGDTFPQEYPA